MPSEKKIKDFMRNLGADGIGVLELADRTQKQFKIDDGMANWLLQLAHQVKEEEHRKVVINILKNTDWEEQDTQTLDEIAARL